MIRRALENIESQLSNAPRINLVSRFLAFIVSFEILVIYHEFRLFPINDLDTILGKRKFLVDFLKHVSSLRFLIIFLFAVGDRRFQLENRCAKYFIPGQTAAKKSGWKISCSRRCENSKKFATSICILRPNRT